MPTWLRVNNSWVRVASADQTWRETNRRIEIPHRHPLPPDHSREQEERDLNLIFRTSSTWLSRDRVREHYQRNERDVVSTLIAVADESSSLTGHSLLMANAPAPTPPEHVTVYPDMVLALTDTEHESRGFWENEAPQEHQENQAAEQELENRWLEARRVLSNLHDALREVPSDQETPNASPRGLPRTATREETEVASNAVIAAIEDTLAHTQQRVAGTEWRRQPSSPPSHPPHPWAPSYLHKLVCRFIDSKESGDDRPPSEFFCPLSLHAMCDPVVLRDGILYEREYARRSMEEKQASPVTRDPFQDKLMIPCKPMITMMESWARARVDVPEDSSLENELSALFKSE